MAQNIHNGIKYKYKKIQLSLANVFKNIKMLEKYYNIKILQSITIILNQWNQVTAK